MQLEGKERRRRSGLGRKDIHQTLETRQKEKEHIRWTMNEMVVS